MLLKGKGQEEMKRERREESARRRRTGNKRHCFSPLGARVSPPRHRPSDYERNQIRLIIIFMFLKPITRRRCQLIFHGFFIDQTNLTLHAIS